MLVVGDFILLLFSVYTDAFNEKNLAFVIMVVDRERLIQGRNIRFFELVHNNVR